MFIHLKWLKYKYYSSRMKCLFYASTQLNKKKKEQFPVQVVACTWVLPENLE